jgi:predicted rRNA methylase YqxC with S4 and FtsJ domains
MLTTHAPLRGEAKLRAALSGFGVGVTGRVCLDLGAAAGGFTRVLLEAGAARVYAVDAGIRASSTSKPPTSPPSTQPSCPTRSSW